MDQSTRLELIEKGKSEPKEILLPSGDPILEEIDEFADCILAGKKPETDGHSVLKALALIRAAIEPAATSSPTMITTRARSSTISGTRTFNIPSSTPSWPDAV